MPTCPCRSRLCTLSFAWIDVNSACVEPWHASHLRPPWPVEKRYSERPGAGAFGRGREGVRRPPGARGPARRTPSCSGAVRRCWSPCRCGSSGRRARSASPSRVGAPTALIEPWQSWHWIASEPSGATAAPIDAAQTARLRARMAAVAGRPVRRPSRASARSADRRRPACRAVHRLGERRDARLAARCRAPPRRGRWRTGSACRSSSPCRRGRSAL